VNARVTAETRRVVLVPARRSARAWLALEDAICVAFTVYMVSCRMFVRIGVNLRARVDVESQGPSRQSPFPFPRVDSRARVDARASSTRRRTGETSSAITIVPSTPPHRARATIASTGRDGTRLVSHRDRDHRRPFGAVASSRDVVGVVVARRRASVRIERARARSRHVPRRRVTRGRLAFVRSIDRSTHDRRTIGAIVRLFAHTSDPIQSNSPSMTRLDFFACGSSSPRGGAWGGTVSRITIGQNVHVPSTDETTKRKLYTRVRLMGIPRGVIRRTDGRTDLCGSAGRSVGS